MGQDQELIKLHRQWISDPDDHELLARLRALKERMGIRPELFFIYRHPSELLGKRVIRLKASSILGWFQSLWPKIAKLGDELDGWDFVCDLFNGEVQDFSAFIDVIYEDSLRAPKTWRGLGRQLRDQLPVEDSKEHIRMSEESFRVLTVDSGDVDSCYSFVTQSQAEDGPDRLSYLLYEDMKLPQSYDLKGSFKSPRRLKQALPGR